MDGIVAVGRFLLCVLAEGMINWMKSEVESMAGQTQKAIRTAFLTLLEERPLSEITVKLIVESCGINRKTFYNHYRDIPDLMEKILTGEMDAIMARDTQVDSIEQCMRSVIEFALQHRRAALHIFQSVGRDTYVESLLKLCDYLVRTYLARVEGVREMDGRDRELLIGLYRGQLFGMVSEWMMRGMQSDILQEFLRICELRSGMTEELVQRSLRSRRDAG